MDGGAGETGQITIGVVSIGDAGWAILGQSIGAHVLGDAIVVGYYWQGAEEVVLVGLGQVVDVEGGGGQVQSQGGC